MTLSESEIKKITGLSEEEVKNSFEKHGYNELPSSKKRSFMKIIEEVLQEPMFILLVIAGSVYLVLGSTEEAFLLLGFVFVIVGITIYQENKTENALDALRKMSSPRALVIRGGKQKRIPGVEVVPGDIIVLKEGDRIPADAELLWTRNLSVDESLLTGESVPVRKDPSNKNSGSSRKTEEERSSIIYSGSLVVQGQGVAKVRTTGINTEMGKIGKALEVIKEERTPLQDQTKRIVKSVFGIVIVLFLIIILYYGIVRGNWTEGILSGITLAMALLPEEFPVVLTIFLALGAWRISKEQALTRKISAVETLGSSTVLCVDKTGTLTENKMSVREIFTEGENFDVKGNEDRLPSKFHEIIEYGILASEEDPFDPMDKAIQDLGKRTLANTRHIHTKWTLVEEYPLTRKLLAISHVWRREDGGDHDGYVVSAKGAVEAICDLCHLDADECRKISVLVDSMAANGLRVISVAKSGFEKSDLPSSQHDFDFKFLGLIGLADPVRKTVPPAMKECYNAGIRVIMITGDYPATAKNIAREIGLKNYNEIITGPELEKMGSEELRKKIKEVNIFARVAPEQKLLIVNALKSNGEIVAMTGDGVNDAPALKSAHIGVAMGERGTDVARESAGIVLLNDDFSTIVKAVRLGRRISDNLKKAMAYIVSVHIPIAGVSFFPVLFGWPVVLYPVHIVFLELVIDPACTVVFEAEKEEANVMRRPPRDPKKPLFGSKILILSVLQGFFSLLAVAAIFMLARYSGQSDEEARTLAFITLITSNISLILVNRSWTKTIISYMFVPNRALAGVAAIAITFLIMALYIPALQRVFHFGFMHWEDIITSLAFGISSIVWFEALKYYCIHRNIKLLES
ncbi:MAG: cation-translocating P-type ATPase [Candidatus Paceibacterota bacterium]|jgi:Ca2+-transporting ATPase